MSSLSLYNMAKGMESIWNLVESDDDAPLDDETWANVDLLATELLDQLIPAKIASYCGFIRSLEASAAAHKAEEERLAARRKARENLVARLKRNMQTALELAGVAKVDAGIFTVALQKSPPGVDVEPGYEPLEFLIPQPAKLDRRGLLQALKSGAEFEGCTITQGRHLRIR